ncbi:RICIN domain-containing protein [uncultured Photobacterium sp.]|uniref:RICIN domain-containing protein n=1 Tax=uncultured Photobacterium sp. TaxID=173973 RepID=UPI00262BAAC9|nr:RICIN domain-containing protein [uncultured Photobacterium sp.]
MNKIPCAFIGMSLLLLFSSLNHAASLNQSDNLADIIQSSTPYFQQECHLYGNETTLPENCRYYILNLTELSLDDRNTFTNRILGLGVSSNYVLITKPNKLSQREIYLLDSPEAEYVATNLTQDLSKISRGRRSLSSSSNPKVMEFILHRRFNVERESKGNATLKYKVRYYRKSPFYSRSGDKDKFVEIVLAEGSGIDMGMENAWSDIYYRWQHNSSVSYVYREYLDSVSIDVKVNDKSKLANGNIYLNDLYPRMQDQVATRIEKETSSSIKVGLGFSPKIPIKDIEYKFTDKYTITNKKEFGLVTQTNRDGYQIKYENNKYGSQINPEDGFCNLGTADGWCWDYDDFRGNPWNFDKLRANNPLALSGLRPDFVAKIAAKENVSGNSTINVTTKVNSLALFGHNRWILGRRYASGSQLRTSKTSWDRNWQKDRDFEKLTYTDSFPINIDWNSPWFLGSDAVTIKSTFLSQQNAKCLTVVNDNELTFKDCKEGAKSQSFIYDQEKRYRSVANIDRCLDTANGKLSLSDQCNADYAPNTQVWSWQEPNQFSNDVLFTTNNDRTINAIDASTSVPSIIRIEGIKDKPDSVLYTSRFTDFSTVNP